MGHCNLSLAATATTFQQQQPTEQEPLEEEQADVLVAQFGEFHDQQELLVHPEARHVTQARPDQLDKMCITRRLGRRRGPTPGCP